MIPEVETAIVQRLQALFPRLHVEAFPDDPRNYRVTHPVGTVLVIWRDAIFKPNQGLGAIVQGVELVYEVVFLVRNLRTHSGAYALIEAGRKALVGWKAPGCDRATATRAKFQHFDPSGLWQFGLFASFPTIAMEETTAAVAGYGLGEEGVDGRLVEIPPTLKLVTPFSEDIP
jgi:hypothetical protein